MRILRAYLLTLEGVNPGQEYKIAQQGLISGGEITAAPKPNRFDRILALVPFKGEDAIKPIGF